MEKTGDFLKNQHHCAVCDSAVIITKNSLIFLFAKGTLLTVESLLLSVESRSAKRRVSVSLGFLTLPTGADIIVSVAR